MGVISPLGLKKRPAEKARFGWIYWHNERLIARISSSGRK